MDCYGWVMNGLSKIPSLEVSLKVHRIGGRMSLRDQRGESCEKQADSGEYD
jgi:hypothetical protein